MRFHQQTRRKNNELFNAVGQLLTGSKFVHEGLLIKTKEKKYYVCQTYPIELKKCNDYDDAIESIKSYWHNDDT